MTADPIPETAPERHPRIRTHHARHGRITPTMRRALEEVGPGRLPDWAGIQQPVVLEVGCGNGAAALAYADRHPEHHVVALDVHTPGVAHLLTILDREPRPNVSTAVVDALDVLDHEVTTGSLAGLHVFFPDPWPKARHHKRRFVRPDVLDLVADRLMPGGRFLLATDAADYAEVMHATVGGHACFAGGPADRPAWRPVTTYERKAAQAGRSVAEFTFRRLNDRSA